MPNSTTLYKSGGKVRRASELYLPRDEKESTTKPSIKLAAVKTEKNPVKTSFEKWAQPGHFSRILSKGPKTTTWIWNIHADAHDFESHGNDVQFVARQVFSSHFGQLAIILIWISGMLFHGARFSNYSAWLVSPTTVNSSSQVVWAVVGQEILNGDVGGGFTGVRVTSGWFEMWRAFGITRDAQLYATSMVGLLASVVLMFGGWYHFHKSAPMLDWFRNAESMMNHHLAGLLGLGCLSWSGHQIHVSIPINNLLDSGASPESIPLPHKFLFDRDLIGSLYPSFKKGLLPFFTFSWDAYKDFLTFKGGVNPTTGSLWLTDVAHHHLALSVLFIFAGHMYRTNWGIGHSMKEILEAHKGPLTGQGHKGLYEILTSSWNAQLSINLAMMGSISIVVAHHMYAMPAYPYIGINYPVQLSLFTHHMWIGGFCIVGGGAHASLYMLRDYTAAGNVDNLLDRVLRHRESIIAHLNWVCIFLGTHSFGLYIHNDTMRALGRPQDMFSDTAIALQPVFAKWLASIHSSTASEVSAKQISLPKLWSTRVADAATSVKGALTNAVITLKDLSNRGASLTSTNSTDASITAYKTVLKPVSLSYAFPACDNRCEGINVAIGEKISSMPVPLGTADFMVHHIHAFTIHVTVLILLKGVLFARNSRLIPDKASLGFRFPCDGPGRGGTCQVSSWDHVFLGLFWMYNALSVTIFYFSWKMQSDVWGSISSNGKISHFTGGNFAKSALTVNGWLRDFLWAQAAQVIQSYGSSVSAYGLIFLASHFTWAFSLMFLFSGRGYWQELIESILWAHAKLGVYPALQPRALSISHGRSAGLGHFLLGGIGTTWAFFLARIVSIA